VVAGNYIGTDVTGSDPVHNTSNGVLLELGASNNVVGGTAAGASNVISGNGVAGVLMRDFGTNNNSILGNRIGTDARGTDNLPNGRVGVGIYRQAEGNNVGVVLDPDGVTLHPAGNLIADNEGPGVWLNAGFQVVDFNTIMDNRGAGVAVSDLVTRRDTAPRTGYLPGDLTPDFELKDQNGHDVSLSDFAGRFVVLDFCAAWCSPCAQLTHQIPDVIQRLSNLHVPFEYVQVLVENGHTNPATLADAQAWAQRFGLSSPVLWGPQAEGLLRKWSAAFPTVVLLTPERTSYFEFVGFNPSDQIASWVSAEVNGTFTTPDNAHSNLRYNSISDNRNLGIDLGNDGVTANTPGTHTSGPNHWQNYPVLTSVVSSSSNKIVSGYLDSTPNMTFQIQFFVNTESDESGHGQGEYFLGETLVTTNANGHATFSFTYGPIADGPFLSATATDDSGNGNTSEFSRSIAAREDDGPGGSDSIGSDEHRAYRANSAVSALTGLGAVTAGVPFDVTVTTVDAFGQVVLGYTRTVTFAGADATGVLSHAYPIRQGDQGSAVFSAMQIAPGPLQPTVTDTADGTLLGSFDLLVTDRDAMIRRTGIWTADAFC
jgi:thiol-disulfide isomerase/thioredoxin